MSSHPLTQALLDAASQDDVAAISRLLAAGANPLDQESAAFVLAAQSGCAAAVQELAPFPHPPHAANHALFCMAGSGHGAAVRSILELFGPALSVEASLLEAATAGHVDCVRALAALATAEAVARPLLEAAMAGHLDCVEALLPISHPGLGTNDARGQAFFRACGEGHVNIAAFLAPHCNLKTIAASSLNLASSGDSSQIIDFLLPLNPPSIWFSVALRALERPERPGLVWLAQALSDEALNELANEAERRELPLAKEKLEPLLLSRQERRALEQDTARAPSNARPGL
jgi:hypothetical protein